MIKRFRGFSLIELIIVIAIIAVLSIAAFLSVDPIGKVNAANDAVKVSDMGTINTALQSYYATNGHYPQDLKTLQDQGYLKSVKETPTCDYTQANNTCNYQYFADKTSSNPSWYALYTQTATPSKVLPNSTNSTVKSGCGSLNVNSCQPGNYNANPNWSCLDSGNMTAGSSNCTTLAHDTLPDTSGSPTSTPTPTSTQVANTPTPTPCAGRICIVDNPPSATGDSYTVANGGTLSIAAPGVMTNDTDPDGGPKAVGSHTNPTHASSFNINADGSFTYVHDGSSSTQDSFTYSLTPGGSTATVTINIFVPTPTQKLSCHATTYPITRWQQGQSAPCQTWNLIAGPYWYYDGTSCQQVPNDGNYYYVCSDNFWSSQQGCQQACSQVPTYTPTPTPTPACVPMSTPCRSIATQNWYYNSSSKTCVQPGSLCGGTAYSSQQVCQQACSGVTGK